MEEDDITLTEKIAREGDVIENFIIWFTSDKKERKDMFAGLDEYLTIREEEESERGEL